MNECRVAQVKTVHAGSGVEQRYHPVYDLIVFPLVLKVGIK